MQRTMVGTLGRVTRAIARVVALPLAIAAIPAMANAQRGMQRGVQSNGQRELFEWRGNVDQEVRVQMRGGRTSVMGMGPREMTAYDQMRAMSAVPAADGYVSVEMLEGRGRADVVQQPTAQNGYTTVVRVRDMQGGAGTYDIAAFWQPTGNYGYGNNGNYGTYGTYGTYGRPYPNGGTVQQPVYQGGRPLPGSQNAGVIYGRYPYPGGSAQQQGTYPNGRVMPGQAQAAQVQAEVARRRARGRYKNDDDHDDNYDSDHHDRHDHQGRNDHDDRDDRD